MKSFSLLLLLPALALASLEDPFEKRVLTPVNPQSFERGLCPGAPLAQIPAPVQEINSAALGTGLRIQEDLRLQMAMKASNLIYELPDLYTSASGRELVDRLVPFLKSLPKGYDPYAYISEPESGMKYMILSPNSESVASAPWILAIAGTQSLMDVVSDLDLGWAKFQKGSRLADLLTTCQYLDSDNQPMAFRKWIFTGHSLGGGLAQAFAYKIQKTRLQNKLSPVDLEVVTFNAFGAKELVEKDEAFDPSVLGYLKARNYFVQGDAVSRIGTHIGPTFQLSPEGEDSKAVVSPLEIYRRHLMKTVMDIVMAPKLLLSPLSTAPQRAPPAVRSRKAQKMLAYGTLFRSLPKKLYKHKEDEIVQILEDAADYLLTLDLSQPDNLKAAAYVQRLILARLASSPSARVQDLNQAFRQLSSAGQALR